MGKGFLRAHALLVIALLVSAAAQSLADTAGATGASNTTTVTLQDTTPAATLAANTTAASAAGAEAAEGKPNATLSAPAAVNSTNAPAVTTPQQQQTVIGATVKQVQVVSQEATVFLTDDINPAGACRSAIQSHCEDVEAGEGRLTECLAAIEQAANVEIGAPFLPDDCSEEVMQFKINMDSSINKNIPLAKACAEDANKHCDVMWFNGYKNGSTIACLRDVKNKLKPACKEEVFKVQLDASLDFRVDQGLRAACEKDAAILCQRIKHGGGRIQACLRDQRPKLSWDCEGELFRKEIEDADDIRLSIRLLRKCFNDKKQFCDSVAPGFGDVKQCLEQHLDELTAGCKEEIDAMIERRVRYFRLDSRLKRACSSVIIELCSYLGDMDLDTYDSTVVNCLQDLSAEIPSDECKAHVHKYMELAAQDIRFDVPLADACYKDRMNLCANIPPGSARVIRCLQNQRDKLSIVCKATLMTEEVRFSENIDFQYPMKQACLKEIDRFCKHVPHGNARVIRCLQGKKNHKDFGKACRVEVQRYEQESAKDYRLNYKLYKACKADVGQVCKNACKLQEGEMCGGKVLSCLTENKDNIKSDACHKEVLYLEKMEVDDFRMDMILAEACRADVDKFCAKVEPGQGRVHKCLREVSKQLSPTCRLEEMRMEEKEADNVQFSISLLRACSGEKGLFCHDVQPGSARVFRCLVENMASADFGDSCRSVIMQKLQRREANWRLDPALRRFCRADVDRLCAFEDAERIEDGAVKKCMAAKHEQLSTGCQRELARSLHMSFFIWQSGGTITAPCDADIQKYCLPKAQGSQVPPGAVSSCVADIVERMMQAEQPNKQRRLQAGDDSDADEGSGSNNSVPSQQGRKERPGSRNGAGQAKLAAAGAAAAKKASGTKPAQVLKLSEQCYRLAAIAAPSDVEQGFDASTIAYSMQTALTLSMQRVEQATGLQTLRRNGQGAVTAISLTGWTALAGVAAFVLVLFAGALYGIRQYLGHAHQGYSLVVKSPAGQ